MTAIVYAILVLFGAPLVGFVPHTFILAFYVALFTCFPVVPLLSVDSRKWYLFITLQKNAFISNFQETSGSSISASSRNTLLECWGGFIGCLLGTWLGAIPIPLDWDRKWQVRGFSQVY